MLYKILKAMVEGRLIGTSVKKITGFFKKVRKKIDKAISIPTIFLLSRFIKIDPHKIIFITFRGEYDCNAKWIAEELNRRNFPGTIVWTIRKNVPVDDIPLNFIQTYRGSYDFYRHLASAKIIVDNGISTSYLGYKTKKEQILMETWHGSLGIKMFSKETNKDKKWCIAAAIEGRMTNYCISNSTFEDRIYTDTFWPNAKILQLGHARNDILCETNSSRLVAIRNKVYQWFGLAEDVKICLYAPTFRDDGDMRPYQIDYDGLREALESRFGGSWAILTRFHFRLLKKLKKLKKLKCDYFPEGILDASRYSDIQEILTCTEVGITDYSSWICDFMLTRRPGFLFATDMAEYEVKDREFFYPLDSMPFPLATGNEQLLANIRTFDRDRFEKECDRFLEDKGCIDDGHSAERISDVIEKIMQGERL